MLVVRSSAVLCRVAFDTRSYCAFLLIAFSTASRAYSAVNGTSRKNLLGRGLPSYTLALRILPKRFSTASRAYSAANGTGRKSLFGRGLPSYNYSNKYRQTSSWINFPCLSFIAALPGTDPLCARSALPPTSAFVINWWLLLNG